jgi:high-affinity Fe2+/Pb2+ permease
MLHECEKVPMQRKSLTLGIVLFLIGLCIALTAAALLFLHIIESGVAAVIGIVGIGLIAASGGLIAASGVRKSNGGS